MANETVLDQTPLDSIPGDAVMYIIVDGQDYRTTKDEFLGAYKDIFLGSVIPTDTPTGTTAAMWIATEAGTYTNFGGVVVDANSIAVISRDDVGDFSISQTEIELGDYAKKERLEFLADLEYDENLVNPNDENYLIDKRLDYDGSVVNSGANWKATGYIKVIVGENYTPNYKQIVLFYDDNRQLIDAIDSSRPNLYFEIPSGVSYIRFSGFSDLLQMVKGSFATFPDDVPDFKWIIDKKGNEIIEANNVTRKVKDEIKVEYLEVINVLQTALTDTQNEVELITNEKFPLFINMALHAKTHGYAQSQKVITDVTRIDDYTLEVPFAEIAGFDDADLFFPLVIKTPTNYIVVTGVVTDKPNGIISTRQILPAVVDEISTFFVDGQHLSRYGYRSLAEYIVEQIERFCYRKKVDYSFISQNCKPYELKGIDIVTDEVIADFIKLPGTPSGGFMIPEEGIPFQCEMSANASNDQSGTIFKNAFNLFQNTEDLGMKLLVNNSNNGFFRLILGEYLPFNVGALKITAFDQNNEEFFSENVTGTTQEIILDVPISIPQFTLFFQCADSVNTLWRIALIEVYKSGKVSESPFLEKDNIVIAFLGDSWIEFPNLISGETPIDRADGSEAGGLQFLSAHMKDYLNGKGYNVTTYNNSHGGMTSAWAKYWLKELVLDLPVKPDFCLINFAINDANSISFAESGADSVYDFSPTDPHVKIVQSLGGVKGSVTQSEWFDNMNFIVKTLIANNIKPVWLHNPMLDGMSFGLIEQNVYLLNNMK